MTRISKLETAKIYQFPLHRRVAGNDLRETVTPANTSRVADAYETVSESWYHEAAIREERTRTL